MWKERRLSFLSLIRKNDRKQFIQFFRRPMPVGPRPNVVQIKPSDSIMRVTAYVLSIFGLHPLESASVTQPLANCETATQLNIDLLLSEIRESTPNAGPHPGKSLIKQPQSQQQLLTRGQSTRAGHL
jgi:hypothetical protein